MRCWNVRRARALGLLSVLLLLTACSLSIIRRPTPPGPGVPWIANLQFDPGVVKVGETTRMSFYFEVGSADLEEGFLVERGIQQFQFFQDLQAAPIDLRKFSGQVAGTVEIPLRWSAEGVRFLEFYVVTKNGKVSNHLGGTVMVR